MSSKETKSKKTTTKLEEQPNEVKTIIPEITSKHAEDHPDFAEFVNIAKMTGSLTEEFSTLSMEDKKKFEVDFRQWIAQGKPKPVMPEMPKGTLEYPIVIWRVKSKNKEYFYYDTNLGVKKGVEEKNGKIIRHDPEFEYSVEKMEKLLNEREQLCPVEQDRSCNLSFEGHHYLVSEELMLKPFDKVVEYIKTGKAVA